MRTTLPRRAGAVRGGELSHSFARSTEASSDSPPVCELKNPWRNGTRIPVDVVGCDMAMSPTKPAIGAPTAMVSTAAAKSFFVFMGLCLPDSARCCRAYPGDWRVRHARAQMTVGFNLACEAI